MRRGRTTRKILFRD